MAFTKGSVVRRVGPYGRIPNGTIGRITEVIGGALSIKWETNEPTETQYYSEADDGHFLELVSALTVDACIAAYTAACEQFEAAELALEKAKAAVQDARLNLRDALDGET